MQLDVQGFTAVECGSNAEPEEFLEVLNSDPTFVEASFLNTGKTQFDLNDVSMFLWQSEAMENSHLFAVRKLDGRLVAVLTLLIPHPGVEQPWIGALIVHRELGFDDAAAPLLDGRERKLTTEGWDALYVSPMESQHEVIKHWQSYGYVFIGARSDNNMRNVHVLRKTLKEEQIFHMH